MTVKELRDWLNQFEDDGIVETLDEADSFWMNTWTDDFTLRVVNPPNSKEKIS